MQCNKSVSASLEFWAFDLYGQTSMMRQDVRGLTFNPGIFADRDRFDSGYRPLVRDFALRCLAAWRQQ